MRVLSVAAVLLSLAVMPALTQQSAAGDMIARIRTEGCSDRARWRCIGR